MKTKKTFQPVFAGLVALTALFAQTARAQVYTPGGTVGTSLNPPLTGVNTNDPRGTLEVWPNCNAGTLGAVVVSDKETNLCVVGTTKGEMVYVRNINGSNVEEPLFVVKNAAANGFTGVGTKVPKAQLDVRPIRSSTNPFQVVGYNGATNMIVTRKGLVGINTADPADQLHVHEGIIRVSGQNYGGGPMILLGGAQTSDPAQWGMEYGVSGSDTSLRGLNFWKPWGSNNFGNYYMFLADNGNVGINDDNPTSRLSVKGNTAISGSLRVGPQAANGVYSGYRLSVDGDMIAKRCFIQVSDWADYVFSPDYKLPDLGEVEQFVQENRHLPGVPSEAEVKAKGVEMGDMNKVLLQKVEELTLYVIQLKKELENLRAGK